MAYRAPAYRITLQGRDITDKIDPRLIELSLTEERGDKADQLDLRLSDHDGQLAMPSKGVTLTLAIGWSDAALVDKGTFIVDEVGHSGTPDELTIRARSAELGKAIRTRIERSYHDTTLGVILRQIAGRNQLSPRIDERLASKPIAHIDQTESDVAFLTRLAKLHDAVATVKRGTLVFLPILGTRTSSGQSIPTLTITRASGDSHRYESGDREAYTGVRAYWHDPKRAKRRGVLVGQSGNAKRLRDSYPSEAEARQAAVAEWRRIQRGSASFELTLAQGEPALMPQTPVALRGWTAPIGEMVWLTTQVTHRVGDGGFTTQAHFEVGDGDVAEGGTADDDS